MQRLDTGTENVCGIAFSADPARVAVLGSSGAFHLWDPAAGKTVRSWVGGTFRGAPGSVAFSPDGRLLAAAANLEFAIRDTADLDRPPAHDRFALPASSPSTRTGRSCSGTTTTPSAGGSPRPGSRPTPGTAGHRPGCGRSTPSR